MTRTNVELVRRWYAHFNAGEVDELLGMVDADFVYTTSGAFPDFDPVYEGRDAFARWRKIQVEPWDEFSATVESVDDMGGCVIAKIRLFGRGGSSGAEVNETFHHAWRFRNGLMLQLDSRRTRADALEAAGVTHREASSG
jgi:ketosteroid isomerase-like protein